MTLQAVEFLTAVDEFTTGSIAFLGDSVKQVFHHHRGRFPLGDVELARLGKSIDKGLMHLAGGTGDALGDLGNIGGEDGFLQCFGQRQWTTFGLRRLPEVILRVLFLLMLT